MKEKAMNVNQNHLASLLLAFVHLTRVLKNRDLPEYQVDPCEESPDLPECQEQPVDYEANPPDGQLLPVPPALPPEIPEEQLPFEEQPPPEEEENKHYVVKTFDNRTGIWFAIERSITRQQRTGKVSPINLS
jgi:hypothetical protein